MAGCRPRSISRRKSALWAGKAPAEPSNTRAASSGRGGRGMTVNLARSGSRGGARLFSSMTESGSSLLHAAAELADHTGAAALKHYRRNLEVERKDDGSPVTIADRSAERVAREWLAARFPADGILGEEFGAVPG